MIKVKDEPDLVRQSNGSIHNKNNAAYNSFITKRQAIIDDKTRLDNIEKDNAEIKQTLSIILELLQRK